MAENGSGTLANKPKIGGEKSPNYNEASLIAHRNTASHRRIKLEIETFLYPV
jgi:hypothetical protein